MNCPACARANRPGRRFCGGCGAALLLACPACGAENEPDESFCGGCGIRLAADSVAAPGGPQAGEPEAERRQITVLFCDLVESTPLSQRLDPEELRDLVRAYQQAGAEAFERFGGHIAQYLGDGMLVYFGYPAAHEDGARRAVDAALELLRAIEPLNARLHPAEPIAIRIGIDTGLVVVGEMGGGARRERLALGETPNLAARLQGLAAPNTVVIGAVTQRLVQGFFISEPLGPQSLKGIAQPVEVYRVLHESGAAGRLDAETAPTPFVDRTHESETLLDLWQQAASGDSRVVVVTGEAGIGKSRLVRNAVQRLDSTGFARVEIRCSELYQHSTLRPVIDHLERLLGFRPGEATDARIEKLERSLEAYGLNLADAVPLIAALLSLPLPPGRYPPLTLSPESQRKRTSDAIVDWLLAETQRRPVLLIVEDLHWIDPSTLDVLSLVIERGRTAPLLVLGTCRPEFRTPWPPDRRTHLLTLDRFGDDEARRLIAEAATGKQLPTAVHDLIVAKTDGVPLFLEEMTRTVIESDQLEEHDGRYVLRDGTPDLRIPETLHDLLMARLDRLGDAREVAQVGAVLGRDFSDDLLRAVAPMDEARMQWSLARSVSAGLLDVRWKPPTAHYAFRHALIQQTAYQSLLRSRRRDYHGRAARALEAHAPEVAAAQPEVIAHHYTEAGDTLRAIQHWQRAARLAVSRSAHQEAVHHLRRALALVLSLPDSPERAQLELPVQVALGSTLMATRGYAAPEVGEAFARGRALAEGVEQASQHFEVFTGLAAFYSVCAEYGTALDIAQTALGIAEREAVLSYRARARIILGQVLMFRGELEQARRRLSEGLALSPSRDGRQERLSAAPEAQVVGGAFLSQSLWLLGYPDQALVYAEAARALADDLGHAHSRAFALANSAIVRAYRGELAAARADTDALLMLAAEQVLPYFSAVGEMTRGWLIARQGRPEEGASLMERPLTLYRASGANQLLTFWLTERAAMLDRAGQPGRALEVLDEALELAERSGERHYLSRILHVRGVLLLRAHADRRAEAAASFEEAIRIAAEQRARSLELQATISSARLHFDEGQPEEGRRLLDTVYRWFSEGLDTADLREAWSLLDIPNLPPAMPQSSPN